MKNIIALWTDHNRKALQWDWIERNSVRKLVPYWVVEKKRIKVSLWQSPDLNYILSQNSSTMIWDTDEVIFI